VTGPTWQCSACDTFNAPGAAVCVVCDTARGAGPAPAASGKGTPASGKAPSARKPPAAGKTAAKKTAAAGKASAKKPPAPRKAAARKATTARKTPAAGKPARPGKGTGTPLGSGRTAMPGSPVLPLGDDILSDPAAPGGIRVTPELAALLPELFHADGTLKPAVLADDPDATFTDLAAGVLGTTPPATPRRAPARSKPARTTRTARTTRSTGTAGAPRATATTEGDAAAGEPPAREVTRADEILGCGCLLVLVGAVVTAIVLLVMNWSAVRGFFTPGHHGRPAARATATASAKPTPTATVLAGTPCPAELTSLYAGGTGATLVAVYERADPHEEYAFCEDRSGTLHYFGRTVGKPFAGTPDTAKRIPGGFEVVYPATGTFDFHNGVLTEYEKGKKKWDDALTSRSAL